MATLFDKKPMSLLPEEKLKISPDLKTPLKPPAPKPFKFVDPSTALANKTGKFNIKLYHIPTGREIKFKAFVNDFSDNYVSAWNEEPVYGRMDPIPVFENTTRQVTLSFAVPASSQHEASVNLSKIDQVIQRLYPSYERVNGFNVLSTAPVWRVKFGNFISKINSGAGSAKSGGLICYIKDFSFTPDLEPGLIVSSTKLYPKSVQIDLSLTILHEITPGFVAKKFDGGPTKHSFPYGVGKKSDLYNEEQLKKRKRQALRKTVRESQEEVAALTARGADCQFFQLKNNCSLKAKWRASHRLNGLKGRPTMKKYKKILQRADKRHGFTPPTSTFSGT